MAIGKNKAQWKHTSHLMALIANCHRDPKKGRAYRPQDFDQSIKRTVPRCDISILKTVFIDRKLPDDYR